MAERAGFESSCTESSLLDGGQGDRRASKENADETRPLGETPWLCSHGVNTFESRAFSGQGVLASSPTSQCGSWRRERDSNRAARSPACWTEGREIDGPARKTRTRRDRLAKRRGCAATESTRSNPARSVGRAFWRRAPRRSVDHGGESGIRTRGELAPTPDFESGTFGHSVTSPPANMAAGLGRVKTVAPRTPMVATAPPAAAIASPAPTHQCLAGDGHWKPKFLGACLRRRPLPDRHLHHNYSILLDKIRQASAMVAAKASGPRHARRIAAGRATPRASTVKA
jgi:hypothetical protein